MRAVVIEVSEETWASLGSRLQRLDPDDYQKLVAELSRYLSLREAYNTVRLRLYHPPDQRSAA